MNINLHIERLILEGLPIERRHHALVQSAVESELARLLTAGGLGAGLSNGGALHSLPAASIRLTAEADPARVGQQIAQAVYRGIGR